MYNLKSPCIVTIRETTMAKEILNEGYNQLLTCFEKFYLKVAQLSFK